MSRDAILQAIKDLKELYEAGALSEEEFTLEKKKYLDQLSRVTASSAGLSSSPASSTQKKVQSHGDLCLYCCLPRHRSEGCSSCGPEAAGLEVEVHPTFLPPGTVLDGKFIVGRVLGHGGFGITYLASDENLKMQVAIKEYLPRELASRDPSTMGVHPFSGEADGYFAGGLERFLDEARTLARFNHRAIVPVLGYFQENGTGYLVMRYLAGRTLEEILLEQGGRIQEGQLKAWIAELLEGLSVVHSHQLLHRDIKPANLFLTETGQLVLLDFGTARVSTASTGSLTQQYTPGFAPPEQCGMLDERQGPWTDIYGVGATAYHLLTGVQPVDAMLRLQGMPQPSPASLPAVQVSSDFETWLTQAMAMAPGERYQSAQDARAALEGGQGSRPHPVSAPPGRAPRGPVIEKTEREQVSTQMPPFTVSASASSIGTRLGLAVVLLLLAGGLVWFFAIRQDHDSRPGKVASVGRPLSSAKVVWIPKGSFWMGSPSSEKGRYSDEKRHRVRLSRGFWMWRTEVTQGQYRSLMGSNPSHFKNCGSSCPVEKVSWVDAARFANRLSARQGKSPCFACSGSSCRLKSAYRGSGRYLRCKGWRLPTEAEWEYAARAGTTGARYGELNRIAWYSSNSGSKTHSVLGKQANAWGLHDMLGNVYEWTLDIYTKNYSSLSSRDPLFTGSGTYRVDRGGSWVLGARNCRAAIRYRNLDSFRYSILGFRLVRSP